MYRFPETSTLIPMVSLLEFNLSNTIHLPDTPDTPTQIILVFVVVFVPKKSKTIVFSFSL